MEDRAEERTTWTACVCVRSAATLGLDIKFVFGAVGLLLLAAFGRRLCRAMHLVAALPLSFTFSIQPFWGSNIFLG